MQKIVLDTNVLVSALISNGIPSQIITELVLPKRVLVCLSEAVLSEYIEVLSRDKFSKFGNFKSTFVSSGVVAQLKIFSFLARKYLSSAAFIAYCIHCYSNEQICCSKCTGKGECSSISNERAKKYKKKL